METEENNWNEMWTEAMARASAENRNVDHGDELAQRQGNGLKRKMDRAAKEYVPVTWRASDRMFDKAFYAFLGRKHRELPDDLRLYNILHPMGISACVECIECRSRILCRGIEDAMKDWRWKILDLRPEAETPLRQYLQKSLTETKKGTLESPEEKMTWALLTGRK